MIVLGVSDVAVSFGAKTVLQGISFSVEERDRVGIIGVNGVGKSTLLKVIAGTGEPDHGIVSFGRGVTVGMLEQMTDLSSSASLSLMAYMESAFTELLQAEKELEDIELAMITAADQGRTAEAAALASKYDQKSMAFEQNGGKVFRGKCRSMLARLGFGEDGDKRSIREISGGQHTRLALARLLAREPDILLLDEPTNHLDMDALQWLEDYLATYPKTVMVVSHDRYFLDRVTTKTLHLSHTHAVLYPGNYTAAKEKREADEASLEKRRREQMKIRARIEVNIEFQRRCGQEHNFVTIRSKQKQLDRMEVIEKTKGEKSVKMRFDTSEESAANVLTVRDLCFSYQQKPILSHVSFAIRRGERVLFLGKNGTGKSTLLKLLCGKLQPKSGYIEYGYRVKVGYYDQEISALDANRSIFEELHSTFPDRTHLEIRSALALFLFGAEDIDQKISTLSGGEKARVLLCKLMLDKVNVLVLDEPTNHLDIASREALEVALSDYEGTVIAVSHDRYFIDRTASRLIELCPERPGGVWDYPLEENEGAYTVYREFRDKTTFEEDQKDKVPTDAKLSYEQQKKARAAARSEEKRQAEMQRRVAEIEQELSTISALMEQPDIASDYQKTAELYAKMEDLEEELLHLYEALMA